jgi:hypothetical protein
VSGPEYRHIGPGGLSVVCRYDNRRGAEVGERWAERAAWVIAAFSWSRASEVAPTPAGPRQADAGEYPGVPSLGNPGDTASVGPSRVCGQHPE